MRGTNRRAFLDRWRGQEIVLVEGGREFVGQDVVDQVFGTKLELPFISTVLDYKETDSCTSTNSIFFNLKRSLSLQRLLPKYARLKA